MTASRIAPHVAVTAALTATGLLHATAPASAASAPQGVKDQTLASANAARARYGARPLTWNESLYAATGEYARDCKYAHSDSGGGYGETLYATSAPYDDKAAINAAFQSWMAQASQYDYHQPVYSARTGNFPQIVWRSTSQITLAVARCPAGAILPAATVFVVARYTPPGDLTGRFPSNGRPVA